MVKTLVDIWLLLLERSKLHTTDIFDGGADTVPSNLSKSLQIQDDLKSRFGGSRSLAYDGRTVIGDVLSPVVSLAIHKKGDRLMKCGCMAVINDCVAQLSIMSNVYISLIGDVDIGDVGYKPLNERYTVKERESFGDYVINAQYTNMHKLLKDVLTLIHVLKEVSQEVAVFGGITSLDGYIDSVGKMAQEEKDLFEEVAKKEEIFRNLNTTYKNYRRDHAKKCRELEALSREFVRGMKDDLERAHAELSFTKKWEEARREQNTLVLRANEGVHDKIIKSMKQNMNNESRCHDEMKRFLLEAATDYSKDIQRWMDVYDKEIDEREMDIYRMKNKINKLRDDKEQLQIKYETRANEMDKWIEEKRKKKEMEERRALENWAAVKIQAWWRGVMFRKKLGPYRKKKKDTGKKKKKKKEAAKRGK